MPLSPGFRLGPYEIVAPLGAGGMGEVYRASDGRLGREVAVKVLPGAFASDRDRLRRFEQEARAAGVLNHPNILAIYDVGEEGGAPYVVSELLEGESLRGKLGGDVLPLRRALDYAIQIARGLAAAHEKGIVHRDLKPENLFVTKDGRVKILDFGLAKLTRPEVSSGPLTEVPTLSAVTEAGVVLGTLGYMSPEQVRGLPADRRSDLFAFGAVLYEMLAGRRVFQGVSPADVMTAILKEDPAGLPVGASYPPVLERIVSRCLEKDPEARFQSARDLGFALETVSGVSSAQLLTAAAAPARGQRLELLAAAGLAVLSFALGWLVRPLLLRGGGAPSFSRVVRLTSGPSQKFGPAISPDGKWVAYLSDAGGTTDVWVRFLAGGEPANLTARSGLRIQSRTAVGGLEISPDGSLVAVGASPPGAPVPSYLTWVIPAPLGGVPRKLVSSGWGVRWSPDGKRLVYVRAGASWGDALLVSDADGGNEREILKPRGGLHAHWPAWSHDGRFVYFNYGIEAAEIYRVPSGGGEPEPVIRTPRRAVFPVPMPDGKGLLYAANPDTADLGLWWRPLSGGTPQRLTLGLGEYSELRVSADGRSLVATLVVPRQSLVSIPARLDVPVEPRPLTDGSSGDLDPAASPRGDRLVFSSTRSGNRNLWISSSDLSHLQPLTSGVSSDERPAFSPDGTQIAFVSDRGGERGIWVLPSEGGVPRLLARTAVLDTLSWSREGKEIVFAAQAENLPGLWRVSVPEGRLTRIRTPGAAHSPAWSPQRDLIAYLEPGTPPASTLLRFVDPGGRPQYQKLPEGTHIGNGFLAWAPDGRRLAAVPVPGAREASVWIVEPDGSEPFRKLLTLPTSDLARGVCWTADGASILLGRQQSSSDVVLFSR